MIPLSQHHSSRDKTRIDAIVIHHTGSDNPDGTLAWFADPTSKVSCHYLIDQAGAVINVVPEYRSAWHAGMCRLRGDQSSMNKRSIGIELVNKGDGKTPFPNAQFLALVQITKVLMMRYKIPVENVVGHKDVAVPNGRKNDPASNFDWTGFIAKLKP